MTPPAVPFRERAVVLSAVALVSVISWAYIWRLARDPMALCMVNMNPWSASDLTALFVMWVVMMVAMMLPSASPMILTFTAVNRTRHAQSLPHVSTTFFVLGYLVAWAGFSILATVAQEGLHTAALVSSMGVSTSNMLGGVLLIATGVFQLTPLKNACLRHCRSPLGFILTEWRDGAFGAWKMGLRLGAYCVGCCWLLMALLFVVGVMNLWWVAAITVFVLAEKVTAAGRWLARITGAVLIGWGLWMFVRIAA